MTWLHTILITDTDSFFHGHCSYFFSVHWYVYICKYWFLYFPGNVWQAFFLDRIPSQLSHRPRLHRRLRPELHRHWCPRHLRLRDIWQEQLRTVLHQLLQREAPAIVHRQVSVVVDCRYSSIFGQHILRRYIDCLYLQSWCCSRSRRSTRGRASSGST